MAFSGGLKYTGTFQDFGGDTWIIGMAQSGYTGSETALFVGSAGVKLSHTGDNYNKEQGIFPGTLQFSLVAESNFQLTEILYADDQEWQITLVKSSVTYFTGFLISTVVTEPYVDGSLPNEIAFTAIDGLTDLKNEKYLNSGALYDEFQKPIDIIMKCVENLDPIAVIYENVDIKATTGMNATDTHSPLNQSFIHTSAYGITPDSTITKWQVLTKVMQAFRCRFFSNRPEAAGWIMQKIDLISEASDVFRINNAVADNAFSTAVVTQLLTGGTDYQQIDGAGSIMISQSPSEINITTDRGPGTPLLLGEDFLDSDFTAGVLDDWTNPIDANHFASYNLATMTANSAAAGGYIQRTGAWSTLAVDAGRTVLEVTGHSGTIAEKVISTITGSGATATCTTANAHGYSTNDDIAIYGNSGDYDGVYNITVSTSTVFTFTHTSTESTSGGGANKFDTFKAIEQRIEYGGEVDVLEDEQAISISITARFLNDGSPQATTSNGPALIVGLYADLGTGANDDSYFASSKNQMWMSGDFGETAFGGFMQFSGFSEDSYSTVTKVIPLNNMTPTDAALWLVLLSPTPVDEKFFIDSIKVRGASQADVTTTTTSLFPDNVFTKDITFFHTDGDTTVNEEYQYNHPIFDDASPKKIINSWQQNGATADNLQDIFGTNLAAAYAKNSQIWSISLLGKGGSSVAMVNSLKDPFNFDRIFQLQNITRDFVKDQSAVSAVEVIGQGNYWDNGADDDDWANDWTDVANGGSTPWGTDGAVTLTWTSGGQVKSFNLEHNFLNNSGNKFQLEIDFTTTFGAGTVDQWGTLQITGNFTTVNKTITGAASFSIDEEIATNSDTGIIKIQWIGFVGTVNPTIATCQLDKVKLTFNSYG